VKKEEDIFYSFSLTFFSSKERLFSFFLFIFAAQT